jgi:uncharacterized membrane protein YgdD (TMEM256/DUF423 family)
MSSFQGTVTTSSAVTSLPAGTTQITATSNYLGSTSAPQTLTVNTTTQQPPVVVLTPQFTTLATGASQTLTAHVNVSGANTPTGTVQFFEGTTTLATVSVVKGAATTAPLAFNTAGTFQMTAVYSGDANFLSATSAAVPITVTTGAPYQLIAAPATITLTAGSTTDNGTNIDIQQTSAFVGNITLACTVAITEREPRTTTHLRLPGQRLSHPTGEPRKLTADYHHRGESGHKRRRPHGSPLHPMEWYQRLLASALLHRAPSAPPRETRHSRGCAVRPLRGLHLLWRRFKRDGQ